MKIDPNQHDVAIYCDSKRGPIFGFGHDICLADNANITMDSHSRLGCTYKRPQYAQGTKEASTFLAGSHKFQLDEIVVYQKNKK